MVNKAIIITLTIIVLINTAQSINFQQNTKTDCFESKADNYLDIARDQRIIDSLLKLDLAAADKSNRIDAAQPESQHTGKLVGTAADDTRTRTATKSNIYETLVFK